MKEVFLLTRIILIIAWVPCAYRAFKTGDTVPMLMVCVCMLLVDRMGVLL